MQIHDIELLAEIGVALLLFSLGLEISFRDLQPVRRIALIGGPIQISLMAAGGAPRGNEVSGTPGHRLHLAGGDDFSFEHHGGAQDPFGVGVTSTLASRVMIGLLVVQDLAVIPMLIVLPQLADFERRAAEAGSRRRHRGGGSGRHGDARHDGFLPMLLKRRARAGARASCSWWRWWRPEWESDTRRMQPDSRLPWVRSSPEWC